MAKYWKKQHISVGVFSIGHLHFCCLFSAAKVNIFWQAPLLAKSCWKRNPLWCCKMGPPTELCFLKSCTAATLRLYQRFLSTRNGPSFPSNFLLFLVLLYSSSNNRGWIEIEMSSKMAASLASLSHFSLNWLTSVRKVRYFPTNLRRRVPDEYIRIQYIHHQLPSTPIN